MNTTSTRYVTFRGTRRHRPCSRPLSCIPVLYIGTCTTFLSEQVEGDQARVTVEAKENEIVRRAILGLQLLHQKDHETQSKGFQAVTSVLEDSWMKEVKSHSTDFSDKIVETKYNCFKALARYVRDPCSLSPP